MMAGAIPVWHQLDCDKLHTFCVRTKKGHCTRKDFEANVTTCGEGILKRTDVPSCNKEATFIPSLSRVSRSLINVDSTSSWLGKDDGEEMPS